MGLQVQICLDNSTKSYYPGETVLGRVVIVNDDFKNAKGLKLKFTGKCEVQFSEQKHRQVRNTQGELRNQSYSVQHKAEETYLEYLLNIFGNDGGKVTIPPGRFEYPFQFPLPYNLPASYHGEHGRIFYRVRAEIPRSWAFDCETTTEFRVLGAVDLSLSGQAQQEGLIRKRKSFGCLGCSGGEATYVLKIPKCGAYVGEFIQFVVEINNNSSKTLGARVSLIQKVKFHAKGKQRKTIKVICAVDGPSVSPGDDDIWRGNILQVPPCVPSALGGVSSLINVNYELKMEMTGNGLFFPLEGKTPIVIGARPPHLNPGPGHMNQAMYEAPPPYNPTIPGAYPQATASAPCYQAPQQPPPYGLNPNMTVCADHNQFPKNPNPNQMPMPNVNFPYPH